MQTSHRQDQLKQILGQLLGKLEEDLFQEILSHLQWIKLLGGEILYHQEEQGDGLCIVVSGRLRAIRREADGRQRILGDALRGESIGEIALFTEEPRMATVYAVRDSVLVRINKRQYEHLTGLFPRLGLYTTRLAIQRLQKRHNVHKKPYKTVNVALLSIGEVLQPAEFARRFKKALHPYARVLHLNSQRIRPYLDQAVTADNLSDWLNEQEADYDLVLYETDSADTDWTRLCLRQADDVLLLADGKADPSLSASEKRYFHTRPSLTNARQTLILLQPDHSNRAQQTGDWLRIRPGIGHFHIRETNGEDYSRLARFLTGRAVGLVLAGGGARGLAHMGVFRALREAGAPVDFVGGTSVGSIAASLIALSNLDVTQTQERAVQAARGKPTSAQDYTLPVISLMTGRNMDKIMDDLYNGVAIEDLYIPFFCISSNLTRSEIHIHRQGSLQLAVRASCSIPGIFPPVIIGNDFHIDGAVFDNLPVEAMCEMQVGKIIAVSLEQDTEYQLNFDRFPSSWELFRDYYRRTKKYEFPSLVSIITRATTMNSTYKNRHFRADIDVFLNPDVSRFSYTNWEAYNELFELGYHYALLALEALSPDDRFWRRTETDPVGKE